MPEIIQGKWDDLVKNHDLRGHIVRVIVLDQQHIKEPWLRGLQAWADNHKHLGYIVDDSRANIYPGTADDPR
jgi:hypothetical protein